MNSLCNRRGKVTRFRTKRTVPLDLHLRIIVIIRSQLRKVIMNCFR